MDLTGMTRKDVAEVISRLALVQEAADVLAAGGYDPVIDMTDDGVTLAAGWVWAGGHPAVIEPVAEAMAGPWTGGLTAEEAAQVQAAGLRAIDAVLGSSLPVIDPDVIDLHLMSVARRGDWHMGADLALLRAVLDHPHHTDLGIAEEVAERISLLTYGAKIDVAALVARLEALLAVALVDDPGAAAEVAVDTGAAGPQPEPAGGQDADAPPPAEDAARGWLPGGAQDLPASQPGMTGPSARGKGSTAQSPEPAPAAGESGLAAAEDCDLPRSSPLAEPPAAVTGTAAAVEAPPLPGPHPPAGEGKGTPVYGVWTAEEDARLVAGMAQRLQAGMPRKSALAEMAQELGRTAGAIDNRIYAKLSGRVDAEIARLARAKKAADEVPPPVVEVAPGTAPDEAVAAPLPRGKAFCPPMPDGLSGAHRRIWVWLDALGVTADFGPGDDLYMVESFAQGIKAPMLAVDMGVDTKALLDRYKAVTRPIRNDREQIQPDLQAKLAEVLRWRKAAFVAAQAA